jgi:hypothetical protein
MLIVSNIYRDKFKFKKQVPFPACIWQALRKELGLGVFQCIEIYDFIQKRQ